MTEFIHEFMDMYPNLASPQLGTCILFATDEWFAAADNVINDEPPIWDEHAFTPFGKWMDGWESRRRRTEGHDWCVIELGLPGIIKLIEVDTLYFSGNFSPKVSIQGTSLGRDSAEVIKELKSVRAESIEQRPEFKRMGLHATHDEIDLVNKLNTDKWDTLVPLSELGAGYKGTSKKLFVIDHPDVVTHIRLNQGPDGGIARIRIHGEVIHILSNICY